MRHVILLSMLLQCACVNREQVANYDLIINEYPTEYNPMASFGQWGFHPQYTPDKLDDKRLLFISAHLYKFSINQNWIDENGNFDPSRRNENKMMLIGGTAYMVNCNSCESQIIITAIIGQDPTLKLRSASDKLTWAFNPGDGSEEKPLHYTKL